MFAMTKNIPVLLGAAALLTGSLLLAASSQAGDRTVTVPGGGGFPKLAPLKCVHSGSPVDFPYGHITNVSGAPIKKGQMIAYKFGNGVQGKFALTAELPDKGQVVTPTNAEAGFNCTATLI